ncbi:MAG: hypothetical protein IT460_11435 [Planctomycetes bacterium]|nr:hypothetical protein [Planctomycetota bacterium]
MPRPPTRLEQVAMLVKNLNSLPADMQWLADELFRHASGGSRRARRLLVGLHPVFRRVGVTLPEPTWPRAWSPSRRHELGLP